MRCLLIILTVILGARSAAGVDVLASAFVGGEDLPYGVATIEVPLANPVIGQTLPPLIVSSEGGRVLFPAHDDIEVAITPPSELPVPPAGRGRLLGRIGSLIREMTDDGGPKSQIVARRVSFLFTGQSTLRVRLSDAGGEVGVYELTPKEDADSFRKDLIGWWSVYAESAKQHISDGDYPPWVETYLVAMLSGRTGIGLPEWYLSRSEESDPLWLTLQYLTGAEDVSKAVFRGTAAGLTDNNLPQPADLDESSLVPLPNGPKWIPSTLPEIRDDVETEPIASRVPPECFYIRFGSFANYLWFLDLTNEYGGDLSTMITLRGTEFKSTERFEQQLSLKINQLTRMLGSTVIEDQAVIGRDLFTADGATMGVMMKASNSFLLRSSLGNERATKASSDEALTLEEIDIDGHKVSLLSSADNRVRSYMAEDDGYFLITNSENLARRFLEVGRDGKSLAATKEFKLSRTLVPTSRDDTIFAYFSPLMLQGLVEPTYLIELQRRIRAKSEMTLVHLARLAAAAEDASMNDESGLGIDALVDKAYLPVSFGNRADGSGIVSLGAETIDTLRGSYGTFLPIGDVVIDQVTQQEAAWYSRIASSYSQRFPQMDPIIVALKREDVPTDPSLERISIHAEIAPLTPEKYGKWAKQLGPPTTVLMRAAPDDIASIQAHVASDQLGPPTHLFAGIKDTYPPKPEDFDGLINIYRSLRQLPAYLGAWPQPGTLDRLPLGLGRGRPIGPGMSRLIGGLYRYTGGGFSVLSFQLEVLNASLPFFEATEVDEPATVRGRIGSLLGSQLEGWVNEQLYLRAAKSSQAGAEFLDLLVQQLHVQPDDALETAKDVLGSRLRCSLGGDYEFSQLTGRWYSTAWKGNTPRESPPADYIAPLLHWFRGGEFTMIQYSDRLVADGTITVARKQ